MNKIKKLLIIGFVWPEPNSSAAGGRMLQLIYFFKKEDFEITFASPAMDSNFMIDLDLLNVKKKSIALNCSSFDLFIKELDPDIVLFDRFMMEEQFGWRVAENSPNSLRLLDTEDLHCLRQARQKALKENRAFELENLFSEEVAKREIASILRCDLSFIISEFEIELLQNYFNIDSNLLMYLPFLLEKEDEEEFRKLPKYSERNNFIFIGNFLHEPNWDAVQYLKKTIWPLIKTQLPKAELHIYGAYPSQKVLKLHHPKNGFYIEGRINNAKEVVFNSKIVLAPLRFGAGLKGKLLEAMQCGTPSVTTIIGAEGMNGNFEWNGFICEDSIEFAKKAVLLYTDEKLWTESQNRGFKILKNRFMKDNFENILKEKINYLLDSLEKHRQNNFIGSLLQHHTLKSTMYMSKWIETKNKV